MVILKNAKKHRITPVVFLLLSISLFAFGQILSRMSFVMAQNKALEIPHVKTRNNAWGISNKASNFLILQFCYDKM